jgi:hypothetical protein
LEPATTIQAVDFENLMVSASTPAGGESEV